MSTATAALNPAELAASALRGYEAFIETAERRGRSGTMRDYVWASAWRFCTRQMALEMLHPDKLPEWSADTLANFRRGKDRERDLLADFTRAGRNSDPPFEVVGREERFELRDHKGRVAIVGKVDAQLKIGRMSAPMEVKSWNANVVARIETFDDLFANRWTRAGAHQLLVYLLAKEEPVGFLLLDRNGLPKLLPVVLNDHLHRMEDFLTRAEIAIDAREKIAGLGKLTSEGGKVMFTEDYLPPFTTEPSECKYCSFFGSICQPPTFNAGAEIVIDEAWIQKLERWHETLEAGEEHGTLDAELKKHFRGVDMAIAGGFLLEGKWQKDTKYELTAEAKAKIDEIKKPFAKKVDQGKFFLNVTKI